MKVGELVNQIETLILSELIAEDEAEPLQSDLESLKELWQTIFDKTSARQDRLVEKIFILGIFRYFMALDITLHYITLYCIKLHYITLHYITLHYITLHYITLHYITLHYISLHFITLHYNVYSSEIDIYFIDGNKDYYFFSRLRDLLLDKIKEPIAVADNELQLYREKLQDFEDDAKEVHLAWEQYQHFQVSQSFVKLIIKQLYVHSSVLFFLSGLSKI